MNEKKFNKIVKRRVKACLNVLIRKGNEYGADGDRLHNFKTAARMRKCSPVKALDGMMVKHLVSMDDIIRLMDAAPSYVPSKELVNEKLGDVINYTLLLEGLIEERRDNLSK